MAMISLETMLTNADLITVLERHVSVKVLDISMTGCLLESSSSVPIGTVGTLHVEFNGQEFGDPVRVTRLQPVIGAGDRCQLATEFMWISSPDPTSLRRLAHLLAIRSRSGSKGLGGSLS